MAQPKIESGKNGVTAGTRPPTIEGRMKKTSPIAPTAAWLETKVLATSVMPTKIAGTVTRRQGNGHDDGHVGCAVEDGHEPGRDRERDDERRNPQHEAWP